MALSICNGIDKHVHLGADYTRRYIRWLTVTCRQIKTHKIDHGSICYNFICCYNSRLSVSEGYYVNQEKRGNRPPGKQTCDINNPSCRRLCFNY